MRNCAALNRIYRVVWNRARGVSMVIGELARGLGKGSGRKRLSLRGLLLLIPLALFSPLAMAAPTGGAVTAGAGSISQSGATTTINQSSQNLSVSWKTFNVASNETVNFNQPSSSAVAINRIYDTNGSQIMGHLNANGNIYLINPNGIVFGASAQVNVGGLVASTLDTTDGTHFSGTGTGSVINEGTINASHYVALLANTVSNSGVITAQMGTVAMGAGSDVSLTFSGNSLVKLTVNQSVINSLVANHGLIRADGGLVVMNAGAKDTLLASVVNNDGVVQARTVSDKAGTITLLGGMQGGTVNVGGTLDASAPASLNPEGGNGGFIETSAAHVHVASNAKITTLAASGVTGTWLIDPHDYTIAASGGDITGTTLSNELASSSVTIQSSTGGSGSNGNIYVDDAVSWSSGSTLTLDAADNIDINAVMTLSGTATLVLNPSSSSSGDTAVSGGTVNVGMGGGGFIGRVDMPSTSTLIIGGTAYAVISSMSSLQSMSTSGHYVLGTNLTDTVSSGSGFTPIGSSLTSFSGVFDGLGHTISNLYISLGSTYDIGLFGASSGTVRNVGLVNGSITGSGSISQSVGDLMGRNSGTISHAYATGSVTGSSSIGVGGLVGYNTGFISDAYATGSVTGSSSSEGVGGLVGYNNTGKITDAYATGNVTASNSSSVGGLVGYNYGKYEIGDSYATGNVSGGSDVGGLVGYNNASTITDSYATGSVSGSSSGGLVGYRVSDAISASYWDKTTSGTSAGVGNGSSTGVTGYSTSNMKTASNFSGWSISSTNGSGKTWRIYDGSSYPLLENFLTPLTVTASAASKTYDGAAWSGGNGVAYTSLGATVTPSIDYLLGSASYGGTSQGAVNAGSYAITPSGRYSTSNQGYDISFVGGTLTVGKAALTVTANAASKTYDGSAWSGGNGVSYTGFVNSETASVLGGTLAYGGSAQGAVNAGSYVITPYGLTSGNYVISYANGTLTINPAATTTATTVFQPTTADMNADTSVLLQVNQPDGFQLWSPAVGNGADSGSGAGSKDKHPFLPVLPLPGGSVLLGGWSPGLSVVEPGILLPPGYY